MKAFGVVAPAVIDKHGRLVAGHARIEAAKLNGIAHYPVIRLDHLSDEKARALALADNKLASEAGWPKVLWPPRPWRTRARTSCSPTRKSPTQPLLGQVQRNGYSWIDPSRSSFAARSTPANPPNGTSTLSSIRWMPSGKPVRPTLRVRPMRAGGSSPTTMMTGHFREPPSIALPCRHSLKRSKPVRSTLYWSTRSTG